MSAVCDGLVLAGTAVIVLSSLAMLTKRDAMVRLHFVTPLTSLGVPLVAVGLSVASGPNLTTASILLPMVLLFASGPLLSAAVGRVLAQRRGWLASGRSPR